MSLASLSIAAVEAHALALARSVLGNRVRHVGAVPGEFSDELLRTMLSLAPFVMVHFAGGQAVAPGQQQAVINAQWEVYVGTAHASGQQARRLGDALQIGAYELLEVVCAALHNSTVPNVGTLTLQRCENLFTGAVDRQGLTVYAGVFALPLVLEPAGGSALDDFETFDAQYDLPPLDDAAAHADWLAGDYTETAPDARDTVTLPGGT